MKSYNTVGIDSVFEYIIEHSRFIGYCYHVENETEIDAHLTALRKEHAFATHICYAYTLENTQKSSDDGEPKGTAGMPILEALKKNELFFTLVAVVRYFGGIKLGAGGLCRAYSFCSLEAIKQAEIVTMTKMGVYELVVGFSLAAKIKALCFAKELSRNYNENVIIRLATPNKESLAAELGKIMQSAVELRHIKDDYFPNFET